MNFQEGISLFLLFVLFPTGGLQMLGFDWKSTELCTYFMGFFLGLAMGLILQ